MSFRRYQLSLLTLMMMFPGYKRRWRLAHERLVDPRPQTFHWRNILSTQRPGKKTRIHHGAHQNHRSGLNLSSKTSVLVQSILRRNSSLLPQWQNNRPSLESGGEKILSALKKGTSITANGGEGPPLAPDVADRCFQQLAHSYEEEYGGFREAPKFPSPGKHGRSRTSNLLQEESGDGEQSIMGAKPKETMISLNVSLQLNLMCLGSGLQDPPGPCFCSSVNLMFLMTFWWTNRSTSEGLEALQMATHTLRMMALGGIHDHVAQVHTKIWFWSFGRG